MSTKKPANAIYRTTSYGPTFGNGHDLHIVNSCKTVNSVTNLGHGYVNPPGYATNTAAIRDFLAGSYQFYCDDWEVYYKV